MLGRFSVIPTTLVVCLLWADGLSAQTASRVIRLIDQRCANCHGNPSADRKADVEGAPEWTTLRRMAPETILQAITKGAMRVHAEDVADEVKRAMAEYISGRKLSPLAAGDARSMPNRCPAAAPMREPAAGPVWNGWSPEATKARFNRASGLSPD
ncbi:MAG TPA: c-type cytochrome, partial [Gemmatimonadales bacterium]|nr:c-type cytochrome [Gemmatimonadales bacterium]